jgi:hypothetical protein
MAPNYSVSSPFSEPVATPSSTSIEYLRADPPTKISRAYVVYGQGTTDSICRALKKRLIHAIHKPLNKMTSLFRSTIPCSCGKMSIGQVGCNIITRISEQTEAPDWGTSHQL